MAELKIKLTTEQKNYIKFWFLYGNAVEYKDITKYENEQVGYEKYKNDDIKQIYEKVGKKDGWLTEKIYVKNTQENREQFNKDVSLEFKKQAQEIKDRFSRDEIKKGFGYDFQKFYIWFIEQLASQDGKCYYCETNKSDLEKLFRSKGEPKEIQESKDLYSTKPAFSSSFHIDRKEPKGKYGDNDNCVLACTFCNNAKSDMVKDAEIFKKNFGKTIHKFYKKLIDKDKKSHFCFIKILKNFTPFD